MGAAIIRQNHGQDATSSASQGVGNIVVLRDGSLGGHDGDIVVAWRRNPRARLVQERKDRKLL